MKEKKKNSSFEFFLFLFYMEERARGCQGGLKKRKLKSRQMVNVPYDIKGLTLYNKVPFQYRREEDSLDQSRHSTL